MNYQSSNPIVNNYDTLSNKKSRINNNNNNNNNNNSFERASFGEKLKIVDVKAFDGFTAVFVAFAFYALDDAQIGVSQYLYGDKAILSTVDPLFYNTYQYVVHRYVYLGLVIFITCLIDVWIINSKHYILKRKHKKNHHHHSDNNDNNIANNNNNIQYYDIFNSNNNINEINKTRDDDENIIETAWDFLVDNYGIILIKSTWVGLIYSWNTTLAIQIIYLYGEGSLGYAIGMVIRFVILIILFIIFVVWHIYSLKKNIKILF